MAFYKITLNKNEGHERVCVHNRGCNFNCAGCAYKIAFARVGPSDSDVSISTESVIEILREMKPKRVFFLGGEPTLNRDLARVAKFVHEELGARTRLGHSNGSGRLPDFLDEASISIKSIDEELHRQYTGTTNRQVLANFVDAYDRGIALTASTVLIPGMIPASEVKQVANFVAEVDSNIPFHITAYIPVPGVPFRAPTQAEIKKAAVGASEYLKNISVASLSVRDFADLRMTDPSFRSERVSLQRVVS